MPENVRFSSLDVFHAIFQVLKSKLNTVTLALKGCRSTVSVFPWPLLENSS